MVTKEKLSRMVKKESILFKRTREQKQNELSQKLSELIGPDDFEFLDNDSVQAVHIKILTEGVDSPARFGSHERAKFSFLYDKATFDNLAAKFNKSADPVFVMPLNWYYFGGFICELEGLLKNFNEISSFIDDDFRLFNGSFDSSLLVLGSRKSDKAIHFSIEIKGPFFKFLVPSG